MNESDNAKFNDSYLEVMIFALITIIIPWTAMLGLGSEPNGLGQLLFIISPLVGIFILRLVYKNSWSDSRLKIYSKEGKTILGYAFAFLYYLIALFLSLLILNIFGLIDLLSEDIQDIIMISLGYIPFIFIKNIFEEFSWRGYLQPKMDRLTKNTHVSVIITGIIWGIWHFPLIILTDYRHGSLWYYLPLVIIGTIFVSYLYKWLVDISNTVWTAVLMHTVGNVIAYGIIEVITYSDSVYLLGSPDTSSILSLLFMILSVVILYKYFPFKKEL